jgi:flagellar protein FliO/FliZ
MTMLELTLKILFSLGIVLVLMWTIARVVRKPLRGRASGTLAVLARQQLSRSASVAVVRVAGQALVVGVTDAQVSLLSETDLAAFEQAQAAQPVERRSPVPLNEESPRPRHAKPEPAWPAQPSGPLGGSALSPRTWLQTVEFLRERTARRA